MTKDIILILATYSFTFKKNILSKEVWKIIFLLEIILLIWGFINAAFFQNHPTELVGTILFVNVFVLGITIPALIAAYNLGKTTI